MQRNKNRIQSGEKKKGRLENKKRGRRKRQRRQPRKPPRRKRGINHLRTLKLFQSLHLIPTIQPCHDQHALRKELEIRQPEKLLERQRRPLKSIRALIQN